MIAAKARGRIAAEPERRTWKRRRMRKRVSAFLLIAAMCFFSPPSSRAAGSAALLGGQIEIVTVPCSRDTGTKPTIQVEAVPRVGEITYRKVAVAVSTTTLPAGGYYSKLTLPPGQYLLDDSTASCHAASTANLTVVNGVTRHLLLQTVHGIAIMRTGAYGIAVELPPGVPPPILAIPGNSHMRRAVVDGKYAYINNLDEGQYTLVFPFDVFPLCKRIAFTRGGPASVAVHVTLHEIVAALERAERNGEKPGPCQGWL